MPKSAEDLAKTLEARKTKMAARDARNRTLIDVLAGRWWRAFPGYFRGPHDRPVIANALDTALRDFSELLSPLPTVTIPPEAESDAAQKRADKRARLATEGYWVDWRWQLKQRQLTMYYIAFGYVPVCIWPYVNRLGKLGPGADPHDPCCYYPGPIPSYGEQPTDGFLVWTKTAADLRLLYSKNEQVTSTLRRVLRKNVNGNMEPYEDGDHVEIARFHGPGEITLFLPRHREILDRYELPESLKHPTLVMACEPGVDPEQMSGHFDQLIGVLLAQQRLAHMVLTYGERQVYAPIAKGQNTEYTRGPDALIDVPTGDMVPQKVGINLPPDLWKELDTFERHLRLGSRRPSSRDGESPVSYATGKGIDALASGFDSQLKAHQITLGALHEDVIASAFALDQAVYKNQTRRIGNLREEYTPGKDIDGRFAVEATYGLLMGINPSYMVVMLSQLMAAGLLSRKTAMEQLPLLPSLSKERERLEAQTGEDAMQQLILAGAAAGDQSMLAVAMEMAPDSHLSKLLKEQQAAAAEQAAQQEQQMGGMDPMAAMMGGGMPGMEGAPPGMEDPATAMEGATQSLRQGSADTRNLGTLLGPLAAQLGTG